MQFSFIACPCIKALFVPWHLYFWSNCKRSKLNVNFSCETWYNTALCVLRKNHKKYFIVPKILKTLETQTHCKMSLNYSSIKSWCTLQQSRQIEVLLSSRGTRVNIQGFPWTQVRPFLLFCYHCIFSCYLEFLELFSHLVSHWLNAAWVIAVVVWEGK